MNRRDLFKSAVLAGAAAVGAGSLQARAAANDRSGIGANFAAAHRLTEGKARTYTDFRHLLEDRAVDAVVIATPDHWHPVTTVAACDAREDVYG